jgi:hypothetical protein
MKPSEVLRKAARYIERNESLRGKEWYFYNADGDYYDSMLAMCSAIGEVVWKFGPESTELRDKLEERSKRYIVPFCPYKRVQWGAHWIKTFHPEDQRHRVIMLLMAADMAEDEGN